MAAPVVPRPAMRKVQISERNTGYEEEYREREENPYGHERPSRSWRLRLGG